MQVALLCRTLVRSPQGAPYRMACVLLLLMATARCARADDWPQWRGPNGSGVSAEQDLPVRWSEAEAIRWKVPVPGRGISSPIVRDGRVYLTTSYEGVERTASRQVVAVAVIAVVAADAVAIVVVAVVAVAATAVVAAVAVAVDAAATTADSALSRPIRT